MHRQGTGKDRNQSQGWWLRASSPRVDWLTLLQLFQLLTTLKSWKSWRRVNQRTLGLEALRHYTSTLNPQPQDSTLSGGPRLMICSPKPKSRIIPLDSKVWKNIMKWSLSGSSGLGFCVNFLPWGGHPPSPYHPLFHPPARPWPQEGFLRFLGFGLPQGNKIRFRVWVFGLRFRVSGFQGKRLRFRVSVFGLRFRVWGSQGKKLRFLGFGPPPTTLFVSFWSFLDLFLMFFWFLGLTLLGSSLDAKSTLPKF